MWTLFKKSKANNTHSVDKQPPLSLDEMLVEAAKDHAVAMLYCTLDSTQSTHIGATLLRTNLDEAQLLFGKLTPPDSGQLVNTETNIAISLTYKGTVHVLRTSVLSIEETEEYGRVLVTHLPTNVASSKQRSAYRVVLSRANPIPVNVDTCIENDSSENNGEPTSEAKTETDEKPGNHIEGRLADLSLTGARIEIEQSITPPFSTGEILPSCVISLPNTDEINVKVEVKHLRINKARHYTHVGLEFVALTSQQRKDINRFITRTQFKARMLTPDR